MILPINDKYRIMANKHAWVIQKYSESIKDGKISHNWASKGNYIKLEPCIQGLAQLMLRTSDAETLAEALKEVERILQVLTQALEPDYKIERASDEKG